MARGDLERPDLDELDWTDERRSEALSAVFHHAVGLATGTENWYAAKRRGKRRWGRALRVSAILFGAIASVLPILAEISTDGAGPAIQPGWSAVALATAAALVGLDRYFGFSGGWMRFMAAELKITRLRHDFEYAWQARRAAEATPPSNEDVSELMMDARRFVLAVDDVVGGETTAWITEFQTSLESPEQSLDPRSERA